MRTLSQQPLDELARGRAYALTPGDELGGRPLRMRAVGSRHMLGDCHIAAAFACLRVTRYAFALEQDLDAVGADARLDLLAHERLIPTSSSFVHYRVRTCWRY